MARFYGEVGYTETIQTSPGVWEEMIIPRKYYGDKVRNHSRLRQGEGLNDDVYFQNTLSIVADAYAFERFNQIRYVKWMGVKWKVSGVEVSAPRLILTLGEVYNE